MTDQPSAAMPEVFRTYLREQVRLTPTEPRQRETPDADPARALAAHPLQFDESGFPVPQNSGGLAERITRVLTNSP
jgi:hypothetical protein